MGCCVSKQEKFFSWPSKPPAPTPEPPETFQEEKVKEVLSETPNTNKQLRFKSLDDQQPPLLSQAQKKNVPNNSKKFSAEFNQAISKINMKKTHDCENVVVKLDREASEVSRETTTTTVTEKDSEVSYGEVSMKSSSPAKLRRKRSVSGELNTCRRGRCAAAASASAPSTVGVSCRSSPSPVVRRRDTSVVFRVGKQTESGRLTTNIARERSVSPAAKQQQQRMGGEMQQRKANGWTSPVRRVQASAPTQTARVPPPAHGGKFTGEESSSSRSAGGLSGGGGRKESLENPLVSLECFIFL